MPTLRDTYLQLPHPLRVLMANTRAWQLRRRRYGDVFWSALPAVRERLGWGRERWEAWQRERLTALLEIARTHVDAYRAVEIPRGGMKEAPGDLFWPGGGEPSRRMLSAWPPIDRQWCRKNPDRFLDRRMPRRRLFTLYTSGTTGSPQRVYRDLEAEQVHYAYFEARWRNLAGVTLVDRWAVLGGQLIVPVSRQRPPFWIFNRPLKQLYLSSYHLKDENAPAYMDALEQFKPVYLYGYASSLAWLARQAARMGRRLHVKLALSNAEPLYDHQRHLIRDAFGCEVRDSYGSTEGVVLGFECAAGRMHISPDYGVVEILRADGSPCAPRETGQIVATGLTNAAMILVRYRTGDSGAWAEDQSCSCGCTFPVLERIEGRTDDLLETADGRTVGRLDPVFKGDLPMREAQIIQRNNRSIQILIVPDAGFEPRHEAELVRELHARLGKGLPVTVSRVREIPRTSGGKFKAVVRER